VLATHAPFTQLKTIGNLPLAAGFVPDFFFVEVFFADVRFAAFLGAFFFAFLVPFFAITDLLIGQTAG